MKIVYIFVCRHYYQFDDKDFGIDYFKQMGHIVEVWSAVNWRYFPRKIPIPLNVHEGGIYVDNEKELDDQLIRISTEKSVHFILYQYDDYYGVYSTIAKTLKRKGLVFSNLTRSGDLNMSGFHTGLSYYAFRGIIVWFKMAVYVVLALVLAGNKDVINRKSYYMSVFWGPLIYKSKYNFVCCRDSYNYLPNPLEVFSGRSILVPHFDYIHYLNHRYDAVDDTLAVFVDEYPVNHSDDVKAGVVSAVYDSQGYYNEINKLFGKVEKEMGVKVVIAAHPKAEYTGREYEGRQIVFNKTAELIAQSRLVLFMYGTCTSYILLFDKPCLFFFPKSISKDSSNYVFYKKGVEALGVDGIDMENFKWDDPIDKYINRVNPGRSRKLIEFFFCSEKKSSRGTFEIIESYLNENNE